MYYGSCTGSGERLKQPRTDVLFLPGSPRTLRATPEIGNDQTKAFPIHLEVHQPHDCHRQRDLSVLRQAVETLGSQCVHYLRHTTGGTCHPAIARLPERHEWMCSSIPSHLTTCSAGATNIRVEPLSQRHLVTEQLGLAFDSLS